MPRLTLAAALAAMISLHGTPAQANPELPADIVMVLVPLTAYGIAQHKDDDEGKKQLLRSLGAGIVAHAISAAVFDRTSYGVRPNGRPYSFPSGHVQFVTSGAAFLQDRYGWRYGLPAYVAAAYVATIRVNTGHHRWRDVAGGAALAFGVSKLFVTPQNATHLAPVIGPDFLGIRWRRSY